MTRLSIYALAFILATVPAQAQSYEQLEREQQYLQNQLFRMEMEQAHQQAESLNRRYERDMQLLYPQQRPYLGY